MVDSKRHVVSFRGGSGKELVIGTDDIREVLRILGFLHDAKVEDIRVEPDVAAGLQERVAKLEQEKKAYRELAVEQQRQIAKLQEMKSQEEVQMRQPVGAEQVVAREAPSVPRPGPIQSRQTMRQRLPQSSVMDIPPEKMQQSIWDGMAPEQQQEWMQRWNS